MGQLNIPALYCRVRVNSVPQVSNGVQAGEHSSTPTAFPPASRGRVNWRRLPLAFQLQELLVESPSPARNEFFNDQFSN